MLEINKDIKFGIDEGLIGESIEEILEEEKESLIKAYILKYRERECKFNFVGIICKADNLILVFPKNYKEDDLSKLTQEDLKKEFRVIYRVLLNINQKSANKGDSEVDIIETDKGNNELSIANSIIKDYIIHGIYNKSEELVSIDSDNEIHWESTISLVQPLFSKKRPIYPNLYSFSSFTQEDYIITQIHKWSVNYCLKKYGDILFNQKPVFDNEVVSELSEIGNTDYLLNCINKEHNEVFTDRNIQLLKLVRSLIKDNLAKKNKEIIFGTTSFNMVWEEVCQLIFNNKKDEYKKEIHDLSKPTWELGERWKGSPMIPDILSLSGERVFTIDAKYYKVNNNISGVFTYDSYPSVGDIAKQFLYEEMYEKIIKNQKFYNIFISPMPFSQEKSSSEFFKIIGYVNMGNFDPRKIWVMLLNPKEAYKAYIRKEQKGYDNLERIVDEIKKVK